MEGGEWEWNSKTHYAIVLIVSLIGFLVGETVQFIQSPGKRSLKIELQNALETLNERKDSGLAIIENELSVLSEILNFTSSERISLYVHDGQNFVMIGRYSKNPDFAKKGRGIQPENEGVMGMAWREGKAFVDDLPGCDGNDDFEYLRRTELDWRIDRSIARKFVMKSRTLGAYAIDDNSGKKVSVIIFESMNAQGFQLQELDDLMLNSKEKKRISLLLDELKNVIPEPTIASEGGF